MVNLAGPIGGLSKLDTECLDLNSTGSDGQKDVENNVLVSVEMLKRGVKAIMLCAVCTLNIFVEPLLRFGINLVDLKLSPLSPS